MAEDASKKRSPSEKVRIAIGPAGRLTIGPAPFRLRADEMIGARRAVCYLLLAKQSQAVAAGTATRRTQRKASRVARIGLAFRAFFRVLGDADFAARLASLLSGPSNGAAAETPAVSSAKPPVKEPARKAARNEALGLLAMLQREARLVD